MIRAVVFDLDGVLIESEELWDSARRRVAAEHGGRWPDDATTAMQGMSSREWSEFLRDAVGVALPADEIVDLVLRDLLARYEHHLPLLPGGVAAVRRLGARWPLGLASSANRVVIDAVLAAADLGGAFAVTVSSEEVAHGKPAPDVYLEAVRHLGIEPRDGAAVEDSTSGIRSAQDAGLHVIAIPNRRFPPEEGVMATVDLVLASLDDLTVEVVDRLA